MFKVGEFYFDYDDIDVFEVVIIMPKTVVIKLRWASNLDRYANDTQYCSIEFMNEFLEKGRFKHMNAELIPLFIFKYGLKEPVTRPGKK